MVRAEYLLTTESGADEDVNEMSPADTSGGRGYLELRSRAVAGTERHRMAFFRFDFADVSGPVDDVALRFWIASSRANAGAFSIDVYGVVDGVAGEESWSASSLSYNSAPGLTTADYPNIDRDHEAGCVVFLGTVAYPGGNYSGGLSLSSQALLDFLNADTNDGVTLFLESQVAVPNEDFFVHVRTVEGVGGDPGDFAPTLDFPNLEPPDTPPPTPTDAVWFEDQGGDVAVGNGFVRGLFSKSTGVCTDLRLEGGANLLVNGGKLYLDSNSGGSYFAFSGTFSLVEQTTGRVHFMVTGRMGEFTAELHHVLKVGDKGIHCYTIFRHGNGDAATYLEQARMVLRCDKNVFTNAFTSEQKTGQMIDPSLLASAPVIFDATNELPPSSSYTTPTGTTDAGLPVYTKYDWSDFMETHKAHGLSGDTTGLWMLTGSQEFMNGGPTKGELFVHGTETTPLMIATFHAAHFIGSDSKVNLAADEPWEKLFGPFFIYVNSGTSAADLWQDALQRADAEKADWPLAWMDEAAYPLDRGAVTGSLVAAGSAADNALMILAQPGSDWQTQGRDYQFWTRTDAAGNFTIPKVRPGNYSLYACVPGISGEVELAQVQVIASVTNDLGRISWTPPHRALTLWQIGTPDRSAAEFRFGDRMRQFGLWWRYLEEQGTAELNYTVGSSTAADWYYSQSVTPLDDGSYHTPKWNVVFPVSSIPGGQAELVIDFAGAMNSTLNLKLNGTSIASLATINDAGLYRSATSLSRYRQQRVTFNSSLLQVGTNTLSFQLSGRSDWSGTKPVSPASGVMYDAIRLEAGAAVTEEFVQEYSIAVAAGEGGTVTGGGFYPPGTSVAIQAVADVGYRFVQWSDGSTDAIRNVTANSTQIFTASFALTAQGAFDQWAASLPPGDHTFSADADANGLANGFEFAYGPMVTAGDLLAVMMTGGVPAAVLSFEPNSDGALYTQLVVEATRDLADWIGGSVPLVEDTFNGHRRWMPVSPEERLFFRAVLRLNP